MTPSGSHVRALDDSVARQDTKGLPAFDPVDRKIRAMSETNAPVSSSSSPRMLQRRENVLTMSLRQVGDSRPQRADEVLHAFGSFPVG